LIESASGGHATEMVPQYYERPERTGRRGNVEPPMHYQPGTHQQSIGNGFRVPGIQYKLGLISHHQFLVSISKFLVVVRWVHPKSPLTLKRRLYCVYISKISFVPMWKKGFQNQTLFLNNFCIQYPNATLFGVLELPFTCQQEYMKISSI